MFEQTLAKRRRSGRWGLTLTLAVAIHAVALVTTVLASTWTIDAVEPPLVVEALVVTFPPPLGEDAPVRPPQPPPPAPPLPQAETQPPVVPPNVPTTPATPVTETAIATANDAVTGAPADGDSTNPDGVPWGDPRSTGDPAMSGDGEAVALDARMSRPETLHRVQPRYPDRARIARKEGLVIVQATIDNRGRVTDVRLVKGLGFGLDEAALEAVEQWRFRPATLAGRPVPVYFQLSVRFTIR